MLSADIVTHREALAGLLKDPRIGTGALNGGGKLARQFAFRVRTKRGRVISAASPYHAVFKPTGSFLGVLKVATAERAALAQVAAQLAALAAAPPADWAEELERKQRMWRFALWKAAQRAEARAAGEDEEDDVTEVPSSIEEDRGRPGRGRHGGPRGRGALGRGPGLAARPRGRRARRRALAAAGRADPHRRAHLGVSHLRRLFWARPLSPAAIEWAESRIGDYDEDQVLLKSAVKSSDGFFTTFFVSPYSRYIARWCAHRGSRH